MEVSNEGTSLYHRFLGHFRREVGGSQTLIDVCGSHTDEIRSAWPRIAAAASLQDTLVDRDQHCRYDVPVAGTHGEGLTVYELCRDPCSGVVQGICLRGIRAAGLPTELEGGFARVLLSQATTFSEATAAEPTRATRGHLAAAVHLTDLFDRTLRHSLEENEDQWRVHGRAVFLAQADFFVRRALPLELVLPAFPCKSTNGDKVASRAPDGGEELALRRLHGFVADVGKVYAPGARLWVVSDGHVFSDCIGVDDQEVDRYTAKLVAMNERIADELGSHGRVCFRGLPDFFRVGDKPMFSNLTPPEHHIATALTSEAELCRSIMMHGCQSDRALVRAQIDGGAPAVLRLYRGFSRFMEQDLELHPATEGMSRKGRKKLAAKIAFEMILRNQAYSNLVELFFPRHIRLSIHAHNNSGPKFGIQLFDPRRVHIITSLESVAALTLSRSLLSLSPTLADPSDDNDLLHIPTPWHNSLVEVVAAADNTVSNGSGGNTPVTAYYVAKAKVVREALSTGLVQGEWSLSTGTFRVVVPSLATEKLRHESKEPSLQLPALHPAESTTLMRPRRVSEASAMVPPLSMCGGFGAVHHARRLAVGGGSRGRTGSFASALMTRPSRLVA